jgi:N-acetylmuramoyl-L-alanine amidase
LNGSVKFEDRVIYLCNSQGKKEFAVYEEEIKTLANFFERSSIKQQEQFVRLKGLKRLSQKENDSLVKTFAPSKNVTKTGDLPLKGYRIALDPGHFGTNMSDAEIERKFVFFVNDTANAKDTIQIFESRLNFNTAIILKGMLEAQGAQVFMTRGRADFTSFNCTFLEWKKNHRLRTLDSLKSAGIMPPARYNKLKRCNDHDLFWNFFRDYDLANRALKVNEFDPHVTVIIHFNVDEKNSPWKKHTKKNYTMAFIGGAFTADNLDKTESKLNFLRLLLTDQLNRSQNLANETVLNFNKILNIEIADRTDAEYLRDNCLITSSPGVFCRNLVLCRRINSPLVYGESLYQDNENESKLLMRSDLDIYGVKANDRLMNVARSYYNAVIAFLKNN